MSIVKMNRLRLIGMAADREDILKALIRLGCVELTEPSSLLADEELAELVERDSAELTELRSAERQIKSALDILEKYAPGGRSPFARRRRISEASFFSDEDRAPALEKAEELLKIEERINFLYSEEQSYSNLAASLMPWQDYDLPLETRSTDKAVLQCGTVSSASGFEELEAAVAEISDACCMELISQSDDLRYISLVCYRPDFPAVEALLRSHGWSAMEFPQFTGLVRDNIAVIQAEVKRTEGEIEKTKASVSEYREYRDMLELEADRLSQELERQQARESLLITDSAFMIEGWLPEADTANLTNELSVFPACVFEFEEPTEEEYPETPVKLKNNWFTKPLNMITDMYSLPEYGTLDPNPLMAPFFILFYGIMMADMGYGLLMILGALFMFTVMHARGSMRNFAGLLALCGVSTFIVGALTGGFFGDFLTQLTTMINPERVIVLPALFTPLNDTITILIGSVALGFIQIITGMAISVVFKIRHGNFIDALFDEITWWIILAGAALAILGIGNVRGIPVVLIVGALMLAIGGTRNAHGFGKVTSLIGLVYNGVSGFFSDSLSYARLMALMLSGSVIAQVFNTLGSVIGNVVVFVIISFIGNMLNFALNLLGCYVHDLRLQCLEFFNRFYKEGGRAFAPLSVHTNYIDIVKEEI